MKSRVYGDLDLIITEREPSGRDADTLLMLLNEIYEATCVESSCPRSETAFAPAAISNDRGRDRRHAHGNDRSRHYR